MPGETEFWTVLVTQLPAIIAAVGALIESWRARREVRDMKHGLNSRMDDFIARAEATAHAKGWTAGVDAERRRRSTDE